jgi:hypothetical protein
MVFLLQAATAASAHDPRTDDRALWPGLTGKEAFVTEKWERGRLLMWAHPGTSSDARKGPNPAEAENWLEDGKPAASPPDELSDLLFPASETRYSIMLDRRGFKARHITVEKNARVGINRLRGNLWIKEGGAFYSGGNYQGGGFKIVGARHTFIRNDNRASEINPKNSGVEIAQWVTVEKTQEASVEFLGHVAAMDEFKMNEGVTIVGPDSRILVGPASIQIVGPEAVLRLHSGAWFGKRVNLLRNDADVLVQGRLEAGSPDRPLTRDATLGISFKYESRLEFVGGADSRTTPKGFSSSFSGLTPFSYGLIVESKGALRVHSADLARARLVIRWHGVERSLGTDGASEPRTINMALLGDVDLNGVLLDHVKKGGIHLADPARRADWTRVGFGEHNAGTPDELFARFDGKGRTDQKPVRVGGE